MVLGYALSQEDHLHDHATQTPHLGAISLAFTFTRFHESLALTGGITFCRITASSIDNVSRPPGNDPGTEHNDVEEIMAQKISPFLWFDTNAEDAANFYVSVFKNSEILEVSRSGERYLAPPSGVRGQLQTRRAGIQSAQRRTHVFKFTEAVSFMIDCADQAEVDYYGTSSLKVEKRVSAAG